MALFEIQIIKTTNKNEYVLPVNIRPWFKLVSISDGSTKYGSTDKLAEYKLICNLEYEVEMPSYIVLESDYLAENIKMDINHHGNQLLSYQGAW